MCCNTQPRPTWQYWLLQQATNQLPLFMTCAWPGRKRIWPILSVAIRICRMNFAGIDKEVSQPIVSTSANITPPAPGYFKEISEEVKQGVDYIVGICRDDETPGNHPYYWVRNGVVKVCGGEFCTARDNVKGAWCKRMFKFFIPKTTWLKPFAFLK